MFEHCLPEELGVDSRGIIGFLDEMRDKLHLHNVMMLRHGKVMIDESFAPWSRDKKHMLFSLTKSFTSTAVGFAAQDGLLSVDDRLIDFFPEYLSNPPCENMQKVTVKNLLTMNTGHEIEPEHPEHRVKNWEREFVRTYIEYEPGTHFLYNTYGTYMLSAIVQKVTGRKTMEYLREKLFEPLGMSEDFWTEESPSGIATGGHGLNIRIEDIAKLGQFYLQKGRWEGKQLLNEQWIQDAQTPWSDNSHWTGGPDWNSGYGYQFWMCQPEHVFRGDGACGQFCVICPDQDMVIAINSGVQDMAAILQSLWDHVLPAVDGECTGSAEAYRARLREIATPADWEEKGEKAAEPALEKGWAGKYRLAGGNPLKLESIELADGSVTLSDTCGRTNTVPLDPDAWQHVTLQPAFSGEAGYMDDVAVRAARVGDQLVVHLCYTSTPFEDVLRMRFTEHGIVISGHRNTGFGNNGDYEIIGYRN